MAEKASAVESIRTVGNWIGGRTQAADSDRFGAVHNSATGEQCASVVMSSAADVDAAVAAAAAVFPSWSRTPVLKRSRIMF